MLSRQLDHINESAWDPRWYALHTRSCHEKRVAEHLQTRDVTLFLPMYKASRCWNNGCRVTLELPLFSGYVFAHLSRHDWAKVVQLSGVLSIVGTGNRPTPLPDDDIERLRSDLPLLNAEPHPTVTVGDKVRICNGPLQGMSGIVVQKKNSFRVVLTIEMIMKSIAIDVAVDDVELIGKCPLLAPRGTHHEMAVA